MKKPAATPLLPVEETVKHRTANLDWESLGSRPCELEHRLPTVISPESHLRALGLLLAASAVAFPIAVAFRLVATLLMGNWLAAIVSAILVIIATSVFRVRQNVHAKGRTQERAWFRLLRFLVLPMFVGVAVGTTNLIDHPAVAFLYLIGVALPVATFAADRMATHAVHWMTANIHLDSQTVRSWRKDWANRFRASPQFTSSEKGNGGTDNDATFRTAIEARRNYSLGMLWVTAAVVLPTFLVLVISHNPNPNTIGLQLAIAVCIGFTGVALVRTDGEVEMLARCWKFLVHWLHYANDGPTPPWVFQSPGGSVQQRRLLAVLAIAMTSIALGHLSVRPIVFVVAATSPNASLTKANPQVAVGDDHSLGYLMQRYAWVTPARVTMLIGLLAIGSVVPVGLFVLCTLVFTGPMICAYYRVLES
jgi:hypothetical protein